jgi:hypothetical protein
MWLVLVLRYRNRPKYYLYNKNDSTFRKLETEPLKSVEPIKAQVIVETEESSELNLTTPDLARLEIAIADPRSNFNFRQTKKGVLSVHITEIQ